MRAKSLEASWTPGRPRASSFLPPLNARVELAVARQPDRKISYLDGARRPIRVAFLRRIGFLDLVLAADDSDFGARGPVGDLEAAHESLPKSERCPSSGFDGAVLMPASPQKFHRPRC